MRRRWLAGLRPRGEFRQARLRLTAWYAGLLIVVLGVVGVPVVLLMTDRLDRQVDSALSDEVVAAAPLLGQLAAAGGAPLPVVQPAPTPGVHPEDEPPHEDDGILHELAESGQVPTHQLLLDLDGALLGSTLTIATVPLLAPITVAMARGVDVRTIDVEGERIRVRTERVALDGEPIGFVQAFHSLESRDDTAGVLARIFLIAGGVGSLVALLAGYWLSGRALAPIQRNLEAQEHFVADASHELRTPIAVVQSSADVLLRHPDHSIAEEREVVEGIAEEASRMGALVRNLLDLGTIDQAPLERRPVELSEIAAAAVEALRPRAQAQGMEITLEDSEGVWALGDHSALGQVARILVDNAVKYAGANSHVRLSVAESGREALLRVSDTGPGIPLEEQGRVFERFARVDKARSRAQGGSGLGLSIARAIVDRHEGRIELDSQRGEGATFTVVLPRDPSGGSA